MKANWKNIMIVILVCIGTDTAVTTTAAAEFGPPPPPQALQEQARAESTPFYSTLQPYGTWIQVAPFGLVWQPTVLKTNKSWRPYCDNGKWSWQNNSWHWQSGYEWGWAAFHHGRWMLNTNIGWVWVPGKEWSPGWVTWQRTAEECRWAPLCVDKSLYVNVNDRTDNGTEWGFVFSLSDKHYVSAPAQDFSVIVEANPDYNVQQTQVIVVREPQRYYAPVVYYRPSPQIYHHDSRSIYNSHRQDRSPHNSGSSYNSHKQDSSHQSPSRSRVEPSRSAPLRSAPSQTESRASTPSRSNSQPTDRRSIGIQNILRRK